MYRMIYIVLLLSFSLYATSAEKYVILPHPVSTSYDDGTLTLNKQWTVYYDKELSNEFGKLKEYLQGDFSIQAVSQRQATGADLILKLDSHTLPDQEEGYKLTIDNNHICIQSSTAKGVFYGIQTLRQIIKKNAGTTFHIQCGSITDYPAFSWRAFMLDEGRYFKGEKVVKELLEQMAILKMNTYHWHLTEDYGWRIEIKKYPKLTEIGAYRDSTEINDWGSNVFDGVPHGGYYTQEEIKDIVKYASEQHINIVPEIEMPGHSSAAIAAYPWLSATGKQISVPCSFSHKEDIFNVAAPRVIEFLHDVMSEVIELFPGPIFHIGGDEVRYEQWKASPQVQAYMAENNIQTPAELQVFFTNNISQWLATKNRRMMGWNEITGAKLHSFQSASDTEVKQALAPGTIVQFWRGDLEMMRQTAEKGYDVVNSHQDYTYIDYKYTDIPLRKAYSFNPIPEGLSQSHQKHIIGLGCQMWCEFIPTVESMNYKVYPRIAAYAECGWTRNSDKDYNRFLGALHYFEQRWKSQNIQYGPIE